LQHPVSPAGSAPLHRRKAAAELEGAGEALAVKRSRKKWRARKPKSAGSAKRDGENQVARPEMRPIPSRQPPRRYSTRQIVRFRATVYGVQLMLMPPLPPRLRS